MDRGLEIAASGMLTELARQDSISGDLANASTPGYKPELVVRDLEMPDERGTVHDLGHFITRAKAAGLLVVAGLRAALEQERGGRDRGRQLELGCATGAACLVRRAAAVSCRN